MKKRETMLQQKEEQYKGMHEDREEESNMQIKNKW